ncbi:choice-of-anchor I family protein [Flavobacterium flavipallidum]|uniref:Choice-of-anchor I family protein n=1 Tax=Flavobacterium flavipallidum TaxID=3139140 RepID=A0ABU9HLT8_9FLAO
MKNFGIALVTALFIFCSCENDKGNDNNENEVSENVSSFKEVGTITIGGEAAAEISAYDETTKRLFTVNNSGTNQVDVIDLSNPMSPVKIGAISLTTYSGAANSVSVYGGKLAVAVESTVSKQNYGKVLVFNTADLSLIKEITVGALPDMVTFSPDGKYIMSANEGEPNADYTVDPEGTVSIIEVNKDYAVTTLNFAGFESQLTTLRTKGFRVSKTAVSFAADIEPEYITISADSKTAWVTLQENNGVAKVDLASKKITSLFGLGYKDFNLAENAIDISDKDGAIAFNPWKVKGMYMPDAIASYSVNGTDYFITANEGDAREYGSYKDVERLKNLNLDATIFPNASALKADASMGRLNLISTEGDTDTDGDLDELISFGARSFTIWNGSTGSLVYDSKNDLDKRSNDLGTYDDARSDDKGSEPEAVVVAKMGKKQILFVGLERTDTVIVYDITNPAVPQYLQSIKTGDAPEGLLFIPASKSPNNRSLLVVSSEGDGKVKFFQPDLL